MTALIIEPMSGRSLVPKDLFNRLVGRIIADEHVEPALAERIMDQALSFLKACAATPTPLSPSKLVDIGWHAFILHTREYERFCRRVAGRFIHHEPTDTTREDTGSLSDLRGRAIEAIWAAGFSVDTELWPACPTADCSQCHNGCADDPPPAHE